MDDLKVITRNTSDMIQANNIIENTFKDIGLEINREKHKLIINKKKNY